LAIGVALVIASLILLTLDLRQQEKEEMASAYAGVLRPDSTTLFSTIDRFSTYPYMEIGDSGVAIQYSGPSGQPIFSIFEDQPITISKNREQLEVSAKIRGKNGLVAEIENNEWIVKPSQSWDRNYNENALEVKDNSGDVVLQVRLLNDRIQFQGKFYDKYGNGLALVGREDLGGFIIERTGSDYPILTSVIEPMFMNNSLLHFGEIIRSPKVTSNLALYNFSGPVVINTPNGATQKGSRVLVINKYKWSPSEPRRVD
jgi:hypothetical protein